MDNSSTTKLGGKFWTAMLVFGLVGQIAWVVENMYFNVFMYKMFHASADDISLMVALSAVAAALTTIFIGAFSDKIGKRKLIMTWGYIIWGITILSFAFIRTDILEPMTGSFASACSMGVSLTIIMDCVMTFFGSSANDAAYNAWLTDKGDNTNRGKIEGFNSMMPLVSILVVFGGFMGFNLDLPKSWTLIYIIIGVVVMAIGVLGFFIIEDAPNVKPSKQKYFETITYCLRPSVMKSNTKLYAVLGAFAIFGMSIQVFMPYLIIYYEQSLHMDNYVLVMAPAIIIAAVVTAFYGKVYDKKGFSFSIIPCVVSLMVGYVILYFFQSMIPVFIGSMLMMCGYLMGMSVFGAKIREHIPENKAGQFQGIRIIGQVFVPGILGPMIGSMVLKNAEVITNDDGTTSFLPNHNIWAAAFVVAFVLCISLVFVCKMDKVKKNDQTSNTSI